MVTAAPTAVSNQKQCDRQEIGASDWSKLGAVAQGVGTDSVYELSLGVGKMFFGFGEIASGEDEHLVKVKRPEDKRRRPYHHPDDRMIHYQYGRYQMAPGE